MIKIADLSIQHSRLVYLLLHRKVDLQHDWAYIGITMVTLCITLHEHDNRPFAAITSLKHYHLKCINTCTVGERLRTFSQSCERTIKAAIQVLKGFKLRRTSNLTFSKTGLKLHAEKLLAFLHTRQMRTKIISTVIVELTVTIEIEEYEKAYLELVQEADGE